MLLAWAGVSFATWAFAIALGVYAFNAAGAAAVGIAGLVRVLPGALASPFGGLLGDRHSRRSVLIWSTLTATVAIAAAALAATVGAPAWVVFVLAGAFTACASPYVPAEAALLPQLARTPQELSAANVVSSIMDNVGFLGASLISGIVLALASVETVFTVAAIVSAASLVALATITADRRPEYAAGDAQGVVRRTLAGFDALLTDPPLRLLALCLALLAFAVGAADVLAVLVALDLLGLSDSSVGYLNAAWGVGALISTSALAVLVSRGELVGALVTGSVLIGVTFVLPSLWPVVIAAAIAWLGIGFGYTLSEVAANTLLQRLGDDEILGRTRGSVETARMLAMALGAIAVTPMVELFGIRAAVLIVASVLPLFVVLRWSRLRSYEVGAPVAEPHFARLRRDTIFAPLPLATLERLTHDLIEIEAGPGQEVITQGDVGDRFYLIDAGAVEVIEDEVPCRSLRDGESFGEIALLRAAPRTATVRTTEPTRLLALERDDFISAVTGHRRSSEAAEGVIADRLGGVVESKPGPG